MEHQGVPKEVAVKKSDGVISGDSAQAVAAIMHSEDAQKLRNEGGFGKHRSLNVVGRCDVMPLVPKGILSKLRAFYTSIVEPKISDGYMSYSDILVALTSHMPSDCMGTATVELMDNAVIGEEALPGQSVIFNLRDGCGVAVFSPNYCIPLGDMVKETGRHFAIRTKIDGVSLARGSSPCSIAAYWTAKPTLKPSFYKEASAVKKKVFATRKDTPFKEQGDFTKIVNAVYDTAMTTTDFRPKLDNVQLKPKTPLVRSNSASSVPFPGTQNPLGEGRRRNRSRQRKLAGQKGPAVERTSSDLSGGRIHQFQRQPGRKEVDGKAHDYSQSHVPGSGPGPNKLRDYSPSDEVRSSFKSSTGNVSHGQTMPTKWADLSNDMHGYSVPTKWADDHV